MNPDKSLFTAEQACYLEALYEKFVLDPSTVDSTWHYFFKEIAQEQRHPQFKGFAPLVKQSNTVKTPISDGNLKHSLNLQMLIHVYRVRGHLNAHLDPLNLHKLLYQPELDHKSYGFGDQDLNLPIFLNGNLGFESATVTQVLHKLNEIYCKSIGYEFMHIQHVEQKQWLQLQIENNPIALEKKEKIELIKLLIAAEDFEKFLAKKYPGAKRFGLEGAESLIPLMEALIIHMSKAGIQDIVFGMAHRGRLNVLGNILHKPLRQIFSSFQGTLKIADDEVQGTGDVKYHLGASNDRNIEDKKIHLSLTANPSHLEFVNPVVIGKVRAKQQQIQDHQRCKVAGIIIHGDAAFAGQGIVAESLMLSNLPGYKTGGTLHLIINNQIGFTTSPHLSRSTPYCSDVAKSIQAPIFHVNADDPEAVIHVAKIASAYRQKFKSDVVIDLICYRRHGHNEIDEPAFTQPLMYTAIGGHPTTREIYSQKLINEKIITPEIDTHYTEAYAHQLSLEYNAAINSVIQENDWLKGKWDQIKKNCSLEKDIKTNINLQTYNTVAHALTTIPQTFNVHPRLERLIKEKHQHLMQGLKLDWATAEALAFGTLLLEGFSIRLSGQDVGRGTFSQRHAILHDQQTSELYVPLNNIPSAQAAIEIVDSPLSETGVLGFDLGYAMSDPTSLVIWEAQFGDFSNSGQVIIDQFISSCETKWLRLSGLVMLLPHGYEGQGPEHSSARLERYLQLCAQDNIQVVNCSTPANYFHLLRRQMHMATRKPLIVMTPKSLLRHKLAVSTQADITQITSFKNVIDDDLPLIENKQIKRVIICSGKVYYDLLETRIKNDIKNIVIIRLEQFYPFPQQQIIQILTKYQQAEVIWCQEEPKNMGAWMFLDRRLEHVMIKAKMKMQSAIYVGRSEAASPATGSAAVHQQEQNLLVRTALQLK